MSAAQTSVRSPEPPFTGEGPRGDARTKPQLVEALAPFALDGRAVGPEIDPADEAAVLAYVAEAHEGFEGLYEALPNELPGDRDDIVCTTHAVTAPDGHELELRVYRAPETEGPVPGLVYIHGGGMTILSSFNKVHRRWCEDLAATGMVVIGVDFRNAYGPESMNPFPTGHGDCMAALRWIDEHRQELGITKLVLQGESGGANLVLATTLEAKRQGELSRIDGVYAMVPFISGGYGWDEERRSRELPSLVENDGYFISCAGCAQLVRAYDPAGENAENPLCWPHFASEDELAGMPPHVISVNELDPLRDEGIAYFRRLQRAGVPSVGRVNLGLVHAAEMIFRQALAPDYFGTIGDIRGFAASL